MPYPILVKNILIMRKLLHGLLQPAFLPLYNISKYENLCPYPGAAGGGIKDISLIPFTRQRVLVLVPARDQATLLPIIQQWMEPNTMIWTDMWAAYRNLPQLGFAHGTVNHTLNFVAPLTGVTTDRVETLWQRAKAKFKAIYGPTNRGMVEDYLSEFIWSQRFRDNPFFNFWYQVATDLYPLQ